MDRDTKLTRLTTIIPSTMLDTDVVFDGPSLPSAHSEFEIGDAPVLLSRPKPPTLPPALFGMLLLLLPAAALIARQKRLRVPVIATA